MTRTGELDRSQIVRQVDRMRADLSRLDAGSADLSSALEEVGVILEELRRACSDDEDLALRLGAPRVVAATYVCATSHMIDVGAATALCDAFLQRGRARVVEELAEVRRSLLAGAETSRPGGRRRQRFASRDSSPA